MLQEDGRCSRGGGGGGAPAARGMRAAPSSMTVCNVPCIRILVGEKEYLPVLSCEDSTLIPLKAGVTKEILLNRLMEQLMLAKSSLGSS